MYLVIVFLGFKVMFDKCILRSEIVFTVLEIFFKLA